MSNYNQLKENAVFPELSLSSTGRAADIALTASLAAPVNGVLL